MQSNVTVRGIIPEALVTMRSVQWYGSAALELTDKTLDISLAEQEDDFDADSRCASTLCKQYGFGEGESGVAEVLSKVGTTNVCGLADAGIFDSKRGRVRLLKPDELLGDWVPVTDSRITNWKTVHNLIRVLAAVGESAATAFVSRVGAQAETPLNRCNRLYTMRERKKPTLEASARNGWGLSWPEITRLAGEALCAQAAPEHTKLSKACP